ncbi:hypothetical protein HRbin30_01516 [bacterium HR30]|nr:hypothetical protein HRbin30_01516 [bacterium HR30]
MIPLLSLLGYELRYNPRAYEVDGTSFAISHRAGENDDAPPVHIVGARQELGRVAATGRPRLAPHSLVQEFLNRTEQLWGLVTNGLTLRILRDSTYIRRQAYVEFDLAEIFEEQRFNDFVLLYRLLHRSRLPGSVADARNCLLERYYQHSLEQGGRVRERLRDGVEQCLARLANGFLSHPANSELRQRLLNGEWRMANGTASGEWPVASGHGSSRLATRHSLLAESFYRQLLRLVYRFLFLLVSEDRGLISADPLYREHYGVGRLRRLLDLRSAYTDHDDLWCSLRVLWRVLADDRLAPMLGAAPLNGELFEPLDLDACSIANRDLLEAFWHLAYYRDTPNDPPRRVNYAALDVEELGSVYESLLDYHPQIDTSGSVPRFELAPGSERKATGSYYTPPELVAELVRSALEPVIEERLNLTRQMAEELKRVASSEWRVVCDYIRQREGEAHAHSIVSRLSRLAESDGLGRADLSPDPRVSEGRTVRPHESDAAGGHVGAGQHRRGLGAPGNEGVSSVFEHRSGQPSGIGDVLDTGRAHSAHLDAGPAAGAGIDSRAQPATGEPTAQPQAQLAAVWSRLPLATRHSLLARAFAEHAILSLRVLDPACGSGHFLLAAARRLGKELARIRTGEEEPAPEHVRESIRDVVGHCIYGVDKNPLAVELCKVALWLEAHSAGKPLTFLDHRIKCGDSLVGVVDLEVLEHGIPDEAFKPLGDRNRQAAREAKRRNAAERRAHDLFHDSFVEALGRLAEPFRALEDLPENTLEQVRQKVETSHRLEQSPEFGRLRLACDVWTAAFFQPLPNGAGSPLTTAALHDALSRGQIPNPQLSGFVFQTSVERRFFHWPLAFPEVFADGGFDVVIGNPPFMGGLKISGNFGPHYRNWLEAIFAPYGGIADLCAAFYRRAYELLRTGGRLGLVATNTIGQGDTRESGLKVIAEQGGVITFARRFVKWPGAANVEVNLVAIHKPGSGTPAGQASCVLDGQPVPFISSRLDAEPEGEPKRLGQNEGKAFQGDIVRGIGFVLEPAEAEELVSKNPRNADCLFPYLNAEDLNSHPEQQPSRSVICFHDWDLGRAQEYPDLLRIVEERVKPERERLRGPGDARNREYWWQFGAYRAGMRRAIAPLRRVLVRAEVSQLHMISFVPKDWIYSHMLIVFAFDDDYHFALLQSSVHEVWLRKQASSLRTDVRYTPTDCFDTFPFPPAEYEARGDLTRLLAWPAFACAAQLGAQYHEHRRQIMPARNVGLTKTYNLFHDPRCTDPDIVRLRELHAEMDRAVLACYGWQDLELRHDFYQNDRGQTRFMPSPEGRRILLFRLMELSERLANEGVQ